MSTDTDQEQGWATAGPGEAESTRRPAVRIGALWDRLTRRPAVIVAILALAAGAWAMVGSQQVFPYLSDDHDEGL